MPATSEPIVIVGGGLAAAKAAETLRSEDSDRDLVMVCAEREIPYHRPPLSKDYLIGDADDDALPVHPASWYEQQGIDLRLGCPATGLDVAGATVSLADGATLAYSDLLLATGCRARPLPVPGAAAAGVLTLRTRTDSVRLREALRAGGDVVIIGAGWIGLEAAAAARGLGCAVTVIESGPTPLSHALGPAMGMVFQQLHEQHGVRFRTGANVTALRQGRAGRRVVSTSTGEQLQADVVLAGVGAVPNTDLAEDSGLARSNGIDVSRQMRTRHPHIYACGDVANADHPVLHRPLRTEHWDNALHSGPTAARAILGNPVAHDRLPYYFSDQYELGMELTGLPNSDAAADVLIRGKVDDLEFIAFWLEAGRVTAAMNVNLWDVSETLGSLIRSGRVVDVDQLQDPDVPLTELLPGDSGKSSGVTSPQR